MAKRRGNNEGTIYQRKNGRWAAQLRLPGGRISKSFGTHAGCRAWIREMRDQIDNGLRMEGAQTRFDDYIATWLSSIKSTIRPKTHYQYAGVVKNYLLPHFRKRKLRDIGPSDIQHLYSRMRKEDRSQRTIQLAHSILHRALAIAQKQGLIGRNPASQVERPKVQPKEITVLDKHQSRKLLQTARGHWYEALFQLALTTGLRKSELLGLMWTDLNWNRKMIFVQRQLSRIPGQGFAFSQPKTRSGQRAIRLGPESLKRLREHKTKQEAAGIQASGHHPPLIFPSKSGTPTDQRSLDRQFKRLLKEAGLPSIRFHDLRHTAATLMLLNGIPLMVVSKRLGHSKPSITLDIYGHFMPGMQVAAACLLDDLVTPDACQ